MAKQTKSKARKPGAPARRPKKKKSWLSWVLGSADDFEGYFAQSRSLALSFVLIAPLLFIYELALVYSSARPGGAGGFLREIFHAAFRSRAGMVLNIVVVLLLLVAIFVLAKRGGLRLNLVIPMVIESVVWAGALVLLCMFVCQRLTDVLLSLDSEAVQGVIRSIGAGIYEEILFRLILTSLLYLIGLKLFNERAGYAAAFAVTLSAAVFALCHVMAPGAVPLTHPRGQLNLLFYFASGLFFSVLYTYRGLGVAAYTHVIYDIVVFVGNHW